jgi:hypothetical protein
VVVIAVYFTPAPHDPLIEIGVETDERAARETLRRQIARLERELEPGHRAAAETGGPQLLDLGSLERVRDRLADALAAQRRAAEAEGEAVEAARLRLEAMLADPRGNRFARVTLAELGLPGCGAYEARPRVGLLGMLAGWWEIRLSSGCP